MQTMNLLRLLTGGQNKVLAMEKVEIALNTYIFGTYLLCLEQTLK